MTAPAAPALSIILPALNEAPTLRALIPELRTRFPAAEILVVDDGSTDDTRACVEAAGATALRQPYRMGNGAAIKRGARAARGRTLVFMDADGQHRPEHVQQLLDRLAEGFDMVVGARKAHQHADGGRRLANLSFNRLASWMTGHRILDLTSGLRAVDADKFKEFLHLLPNGFSYPTTITMAFFRSGYAVAYEPVAVQPRGGAQTSHLRPFVDGPRFLLIIIRIGSLYSPFRLFLPVSLAMFSLGLANYLYTYFTDGRFTNMSALLFTTSLLTFLIGIVSEQITSLLYSRR